MIWRNDDINEANVMSSENRKQYGWLLMWGNWWQIIMKI